MASKQLALLSLSSLDLLSGPVFLKCAINFLLGEVAELIKYRSVSIEADYSLQPLLHESVLHLCVLSLLEELAL